MRMIRKSRILLFVAVLFFVGTHMANAAPEVENLFITDVTTVSFSVIWASSEPSSASLLVYQDENGDVQVDSSIIIPHPVNSGDEAIRTAAENNGVMKVMVTGLEADTTYYFHTLTTSKNSSETTTYPESDLLSVTTEIQTTRTYESGGDILPFSNDIIIEPCYLEDGVTPATGSLLIASVAGGHYPITAFVGDGVALPFALIDLNNIFCRLSFENLDVVSSKNLILVNYGALQGYAVVNHSTPQDNELCEIKSADYGMDENWNFVAFQVEPTDTELTGVFGDDFSKIIAVWAYDEASAQWSKYKDYDPFNTNDLTDIHALKGYWVDIAVDEHASIKVYGDLRLNTPIQLYTGWNLVGYNSLNEIDLIPSLASISVNSRRFGLMPLIQVGKNIKLMTHLAQMT